MQAILKHSFTRQNLVSNHSPSTKLNVLPRAAVVHLNYRTGSTLVPVCTVRDSMDRLAGATKLTRSDFMLHIG